MEKLISLQWLGADHQEHEGDALVEYIRYDEDGKIVNEVTEVFLPEHAPTDLVYRQVLREEVINTFHTTL